MSSKVTASFQFRKEEMKDVPVLNPGEGFGKCWLIELGGSYYSSFVVIEADSEMDALEALSDDKDWSHHTLIDIGSLADYFLGNDEEGQPVYEVYWNNVGNPCDFQNVAIYGPFDVKEIRYHAAHLPKKGCEPKDYSDDGVETYKQLVHKYAIDRRNGEAPELLKSLCDDVFDLLMSPSSRYGRGDTWEDVERVETSPLALADYLLEQGEPEDSDIIKGLRMLASE